MFCFEGGEAEVISSIQVCAKGIAEERRVKLPMFYFAPEGEKGQQQFSGIAILTPVSTLVIARALKLQRSSIAPSGTKENSSHGN